MQSTSAAGWALRCLQETDPSRKCQLTAAAAAAIASGEITIGPDSELPIVSLPVPGRPDLPRLVQPRELKQRKLGSVEGRAALLHCHQGAHCCVLARPSAARRFGTTRASNCWLWTRSTTLRPSSRRRSCSNVAPACPKLPCSTRMRSSRIGWPPREAPVPAPRPGMTVDHDGGR